jgi:sterol desaturase/sphingolipid hydroxylase (fatty acid hydroxylase superfamily)
MLDNILTYHNEIKFIALFGGILLFFLIEAGIPRRSSTATQAQRWLNNIILALFNFYFITLLTFQVAVAVLWFQPETTLLQRFDLPIIVSVCVSILIFDCANYWIHRAFHSVPLLWRLHLIHHTDTEVDVTTANRHHPLESMMSLLVFIPVTVLLGAPIFAAVIYIYLSLFTNLFRHANIRLPRWLDRVLRLFIVTPDFHRMHHSSEWQHSDSNYGSIFPWFDYLFGTAVHPAYETLPELQLGVKNRRNSFDERLDQLLCLPFTDGKNPG